MPGAPPRAAWQFAAWAEEFSLCSRKAIVICIALFYLLSFNGLWRFGPDSALYLDLGRSIARGQGPSYLGAPQPLLYPGLPYLIAGAMRISERHAIAIVDAAMLLMGLGSIYLAWELFRRLTRPGAAIAATVFLAANFNLYERSFEILPDIPMLLGSVMILLGGVMSGAIPALRLDELAHRTSGRGRWVGALILSVGLAICAFSGPMIMVLACCLSGVGLISVMAQRRWRSVRMLTALVGAFGGVYLLVGLSDSARANVLFTLRSGITQAAQLLLQHDLAPHYMIPLLPILVLLWWETASRLNVRLGMYAGNVVAILMFVLLIPGAVRCVSEVWYDQYRLPFAQHYHGGAWAAVSEAGTLIRASTPPDAVIIAPGDTDRVLTFIADRWVIPANGPVPQRMRFHPVYVLLDRQNGDASAQTGVELGEQVGQTDSKSPAGDFCVLKKAKWK